EQRGEQRGEPGEDLGDGAYLNIDAIYSLAFHPTRPTIAVLGGLDGVVSLFDVETWTTIDAVSGDNGVNVVRFDPTGRLLAVAYNTDRDNVVVYDADTLDPLITLSGHSGAVNAVAFSPDGSRLITGSEDSTARLWDSATGELLVTYGPFEDSVEPLVSVNGVAFGADSVTDDPVVHVATDVGAIYSLHRDTGATLVTFDTGATASTVSEIALSPDRMTLFSAGYDGIGSLWDARDGTLIRTLRPTSPLDSLISAAFSPDGLSIASGMQDGSIRRWYVRSGAETARLQALQIALDDDGRALVYAPDGTLYSTSSDGAFTRWSLTLDAAEALAWARDHRYLRDLTCQERIFNRIPPLCS
ncbi:MAG: hypothetical protein SGJ24_12875, partial [Chloroflexota bacterium]|nr:hypothetical protein [Chloroflexota bacterium]